MVFSKKNFSKIIHILLISCFFANSLYGSDDEDSGIMSLFGGSSKTKKRVEPGKSTHNNTAARKQPTNSTSGAPKQQLTKALSSAPASKQSQNPTQSPTPQPILSTSSPQTLTAPPVVKEIPISEKAEAFLQELPEIFKKIEEIEKLIVPFVPRNSKNPVDKLFKSDDRQRCDWRSRLAFSVKGEDPEKTDIILETMKSDLRKYEAKKAKEASSKNSESKNDETLKIGTERPLTISETKIDDHTKNENFIDMSDVLKLMNTWFFRVCESTVMESKGLSTNLEYLLNRLREVEPQLKSKPQINSLHGHLSTQKNSDIIILGLINSLVGEYFLLQIRPMYEQIFPTFNNLRIESFSLKKLIDGAEEDEVDITKILANKSVYQDIQGFIGYEIIKHADNFIDTYKKKVANQHHLFNIKDDLAIGHLD